MVGILRLGLSILACSAYGLVLHSIVGAITIDIDLTIIFVKMIGKLGIGRLGICGFSNVKTNAAFFVSAAIGSPSHVFVDWLHHPSNLIL
jgi:hypothetical protein